jgi:hypothetical protein
MRAEIGKTGHIGKVYTVPKFVSMKGAIKLVTGYSRKYMK